MSRDDTIDALKRNRSHTLQKEEEEEKEKSFEPRETARRRVLRKISARQSL